MSTADIQKEALFDPRVVQNPARYAVQKGGVSIATAPFNAVSQSASQHTYNINCPSLQTFVDRAVDWQSTCQIQFSVAVSTPQPVANTEPVFVLGRDGALAPFPLQTLLTTLTAQINDTTVSINTDTVLREVLRLTDYKANRKLRTCPTALDKYASYNDAYLAVNNNLASYLDATSNDEVPNGAYWDIQWMDGAQNLLSGNGNYVSGATTVYYVNGVPVRTGSGTGAEPASYPLFLRFTSKEKLVLSPFIFADSHEYSTGLFSINNIQLVMNIGGTNIQRVLRTTTQGGRTVSAVAFQSVPFLNSKIVVQFITPSLDLPLPTKSVVPYTDFPRFISTGFGAIAAGGTASGLASQTITLPSIPDLMIIYAKPDPSTLTSTDCDFYLPITNINLNFNNFSGLMNGFTAEQLYHLSVANGLDMDYNTWSGRSWSARTGAPVPTVGGFLVIKPGQDFALQTGEAPGLQGQITVQFNVNVYNQTAASRTPQLYLIAVQSGFFETLAGSSRIVKNVLSEADVINAPVAAEQSVVSLARTIGAGAMSSLGNALSKALKSYAPPVKQVMPAKSAMGSGPAMGGAPMGGAIGGKKKSLSARLM